MTSYSFRRVLALMVVLTVPGCVAPVVRPTPPAAADSLQISIADHLYFGRGIPSGGVVSDSDWERFLAETVTPRFPAGLTVLRGQGQWRDKAGVIWKEDGFILQLLHPGDAISERSVREIMSDYKTRFKQDAVLRVRDTVRIQFW